MEAEHRTTLIAEYVQGKAYAKWNMLSYRGRRSFLDSSVHKLIAIGMKTGDRRQQQRLRPLVLGIGSVGFALGGLESSRCPLRRLVGWLSPFLILVV